MKTRFLSILSTFALAVCVLAQPFVKNTVTTNEVVSGVLTPTHNLVTVRTNFTVTGTQNVNDLQASTLTITNSWNAIGATNMLMANMRSSTNTSLSIGVSNVYATGEASWPTGHVAYLFATNANYGSANVTNLYTLITNSPLLGTDGNGKLIGTNGISAANITSGTNTASVGFGPVYVSGEIHNAGTTPYLRFYGPANYGGAVQYYANGVQQWNATMSAGSNYTIYNNTATAAAGYALAVNKTNGDVKFGIMGSADEDTGAKMIVKGTGDIYVPGNVGIGTNAPQAPFHVYQSSPAADAKTVWIGNSGTNPTFTHDEDGDTTNAGALYVGGTTKLGDAVAVDGTLTSQRSLIGIGGATYYIGFLSKGRWYSRVDGEMQWTKADTTVMLGLTNGALSVPGALNVTSNITAVGASNYFAGYTTIANTLNVSGTGSSNILGLTYFTNAFYLTTPVWRDHIAAPTVLSKGGTATERNLLKPGSIITVDAWKQGSYGDGEAQFNHDLATTNSTFPDLYIVPHVHLSCTNLPTDKSNTTWACIYNWTAINSLFTNSLDGAVTNTFTLEAFKHHIGAFTPVTNNVASGSISSVFTYRLIRLDGGDGDLDDAEGITRLHDFDIHYPVNRLGSSGPSTY